MAIKGLTDKGLSFPQIGRIKKGELVQVAGKKKGVTRPVDLDYFKVEFSDDQEGEELAAKFLEVYGPEPKSINIFLPFNEIEQMWDGFLEAYTASRLLARSNGKPEDGGIVLFRCDGKTGGIIVRNGENLDTGLHEPHPADNIAGYDYENKPVYYSPIGRLKVIVPELAEAAYLLFVTGSWNDIRFISQQLAGLKELNNGVISGVPLKLIRSDHEVMAPIKGKRTRVTKSLISIKADPEWVAARIAESKVQAFPAHIATQMLEPGEMVEESETATLTALTHPDQWEAPTPPENPPEAVIEPPQDKSKRIPYRAEEVKTNIQKGIEQYNSLLEHQPDRYAVQVKLDSQVIESIVNTYIPSGEGDDKFRYAIFEYLLGKGKGSTKTWTAQEVGTIKNLWLKVMTYGDVLGEIEEEELRRVWNHVQLSQGQTNLFE